MDSRKQSNSWKPGNAPVAVVMISLNEAHNMEDVLENLKGWAQEVFLVDSYSQDNTVDIALKHGVHVVQRRFLGFGDQWNFALRELPITAPWTMKLDPDERLSDSLKNEIILETDNSLEDGFLVNIHLHFMERRLPISLALLRVWRSGAATFSDVLANEHAIVNGQIGKFKSDLEHHDSPDLDHWIEKQNRYTTSEAIIAYQGYSLSEKSRLFGNRLQRRMWLKKNFYRVPGRYLLLFLYYWLLKGTWRVGWVGYAWAKLRADVMRMVEFKRKEMELTGRLPAERAYGPGHPDQRVRQHDCR